VLTLASRAMGGEGPDTLERGEADPPNLNDTNVEGVINPHATNVAGHKDPNATNVEGIILPVAKREESLARQGSGSQLRGSNRTGSNRTGSNRSKSHRSGRSNRSNRSNRSRSLRSGNIIEMSVGGDADNDPYHGTYPEGTSQYPLSIQYDPLATLPHADPHPGYMTPRSATETMWNCCGYPFDAKHCYFSFRKKFRAYITMGGWMFFAVSLFVLLIVYYVRREKEKEIILDGVAKDWAASGWTSYPARILAHGVTCVKGCSHVYVRNNTLQMAETFTVCSMHGALYQHIEAVGTVNPLILRPQVDTSREGTAHYVSDTRRLLDERQLLHHEWRGEETRAAMQEGDDTKKLDSSNCTKIGDDVFGSSMQLDATMHASFITWGLVEVHRPTDVLRRCAYTWGSRAASLTSLADSLDADSLLKTPSRRVTYLHEQNNCIVALEDPTDSFLPFVSRRASADWMMLVGGLCIIIFIGALATDCLWFFWRIDLGCGWGMPDLDSASEVASDVEAEEREQVELTPVTEQALSESGMDILRSIADVSYRNLPRSAREVAVGELDVATETKRRIRRKRQAPGVCGLHLSDFWEDLGIVKATQHETPPDSDWSASEDSDGNHKGPQVAYGAIYLKDMTLDDVPEGSEERE